VHYYIGIFGVSPLAQSCSLLLYYCYTIEYYLMKNDKAGDPESLQTMGRFSCGDNTALTIASGALGVKILVLLS
jgi:hypothetical protein